MVTAIVGFVLAFLIIAAGAIAFAIGGICLIWLFTFIGLTLATFGVRLLFGG